MRVLVLSSTFPNANEPARGIFIFERIRRLARRCELIVVSPVPWFPLNRWVRRTRATLPYVENLEGVTVYHPRFFSIPRYGKFLDGAFYFLCLIPFIARLQRRFRFELVDAHFEFPDGVGATLIARLFRRPVIVTLRGKLVRLSGYRLHRPQLRWMLHRADRVLAVSSYLRGIAEQLGIPSERVRLIRNGVDANLFAPMDQGEARRLCRLPDDRTILITVGGLEAHKGQHTVLEALPALIERWPKLLYVMIGAGRPGDRYPRRLERSVSRFSLAEHVVFAGPRRHAELRPWFCAANLFVLLTKSEGWPNVLLESLACGVPVVATRVGGVPEIVRDGVDGILVPYGDVPAFRAAVRQALAVEWNRTAIAHYAHSLDWTEVIEHVLEEMVSALKDRHPTVRGC